MASDLVRTFFRAELQAWQAAHPDPDPLVDPLTAVYVETVNVSPDPRTMPAQWSTLFFPPSSSAPAAIGKPTCTRETGIVDIILASKAGLNGDANVMAIAEALRPLLRSRATRLSTTPPTDLRTEEPQPPTTPDDASGRWFFATVSVPYQCDIFE